MKSSLLNKYTDAIKRAFAKDPVQMSNERVFGNSFFVGEDIISAFCGND